MRKLLLLLTLVATMTLWPRQAVAQRPGMEPFDVDIEYVDDVLHCRPNLPQLDFVYGNANVAAPGFVVVVTPHPERATVAVLSTRTVNPNDFRVWVEASLTGNSGWKPFGLFTSDTQTLQFLEIRRYNTRPFALFISKDNIVQQMSHVDMHNVSSILPFYLRFHFAANANSKWPTGKAIPKAHPSKVLTYLLKLFPGENFLSNKIERVEMADEYMHQHPEREYFYRAEEVWQCSGWYFHLSYKDKVVLKRKVNNDHYVIFTLWKDEAHTQPLLISYFKDNLYPGGASDDPTKMEERFNYVAYPHKGFDDWSLFIPWECVSYWWKDGIKPTKDNHTCVAYFTLTLSNDGKTPATRNDYDAYGWLSVDLEWDDEKPQNVTGGGGGGGNVGGGGNPPQQQCRHPRFKMGQEKRGPFSELLPNGCTREYDLYNRWKECLDCHIYFDHEDNHRVYTSTRCTRHDMKETSRREVGRQEVRTPNAVVTKKVFEVVSQCQNECCAYKETHREYTTDNAPVPTPRPPIPEQRCPPHYWQYFSRSLLTPDIVNSFTTGRPPYSDATLNIKVGAADCSMFRHTFQGETAHCYISQQPVGRQLWLALNGDNNYLALSATDPGVLNEVTYQEVYDMIDTLNAVVRDSMNMNMLLTLPTADEMKQLIAQKKVRFDTDPVQKLTAFYVDSVEVYDGKDRLVPADKLATAPEGARLRVMVGRMTSSGEVEMVDSSTADATTGIVLKATPFSTLCHHVKRTPGKYYVINLRQCKLCKKLEVTSENTFRNARYHRPLVDEP